MPTDPAEKNVNGVKIDTQKADKVLSWLIRREAENVRTKARSDMQMISDIEKRIEEEMQCY